MKKILMTVTIILFVLSTGCTQYVKDENKKIITNQTTGQNLTANLLCKPTDEENLTLYEEHNNLPIKIDDLPNCEEFKINSLEYNNLWETIFVKPLAWIILQVGKIVKNYGLAVMLLGLIIRILLLPLSIKSAKQSANMAKVQPEMAKIERKYADKKDSSSQLAKSQEMMLLYKKYDISPMSGCLTAFIQLPIFFAFLEAINRLPAVFEGTFYSLPLGMTPWVGISNGNYWYFILILLIIGTTFFSFRNSMSQVNGEAEKQMQFASKLMIITISIASLRLPTAIALYWIVTNGFAIIQNKIVKGSVKNGNNN